MRPFSSMLWALGALGLAPGPAPASALPAPVELRQRIEQPGGPQARVALTLDACGGGFDEALARFLIERRIPATLFVTRRWLERNRDAVALLLAHRELFQIEDHGAAHVRAVIGADRRVYGLPGARDLAALRAEVEQGAAAVRGATGVAPRWYRGATARYDPEALRAIDRWGYWAAGFSLNADAGATLGAAAVAQRVMQATDGDVILAHINHPQSGTGAGLMRALPQLQARGIRFVRLDAVTLAAER